MEKYIKMMKDNNLKITPKRKSIIAFFLENNVYSTPESVWNHLKKNFKKIGLPTVYRNLAEFEKIGILTKIEGEEERMYYGLCKAENPFSHHHHIVCIKCHKVGLVESCDFDEIVEKIEKLSGFKVVSHYLQIKGICKNCLRKQ
ncbi:transcriptional repressor [bacterium]|nr:transcriptional repressor [bacterium]